jgi:4-amino-4-deoxy-L-arabinose transferase-like glycosyltransferase
MNIRWIKKVVLIHIIHYRHFMCYYEHEVDIIKFKKWCFMFVMNTIRNFDKEYIWIAILCMAAFFIHNSLLPTDIMESRNIVTAREMVSDGNWMVPTMNGELRLEKPPLPTWVAAVIERVAPDNLGAQRIAAGVMGVVWVIFMYLTAQYITRRRDFAFITAIVFLTCYNVVLMGRTATWDIYCHSLMMGAIYFLMRGLYDDRYYEVVHKWRWFILSGIMMGLSFLSKGPVAFYALLFPFLISMLIMQRPYMRGKWLPLVVMIVVCVVISSWWYVCLMAFHPQAFDHVVSKESGSWINHNVRPWYYYWRFFTETGVWTILMLVSLAVPYWKHKVTMRREYIIMVTWTIATLILLSLMPEKKMRYLLPMMAPCSMTVAVILFYFVDRRKLDHTDKVIFRINGYVLAGITLLLPIGVHLVAYKRNVIDFGTTIFVDIMFLGIGLWMLFSTQRLRSKSLLNGIAALFLVTECFLIGTIGKVLGNTSAHSIRETQKITALNKLPFYYNTQEELRIELVYEAHRKIKPLDLSDEKAVMKALPCALVTRNSAGMELSKSLLQKIDTVKIGVYDDNRHSKHDRHYNRILVNQVTILKQKR